MALFAVSRTCSTAAPTLRIHRTCLPVPSLALALAPALRRLQATVQCHGRVCSAAAVPQQQLQAAPECLLHSSLALSNALLPLAALSPPLAPSLHPAFSPLPALPALPLPALPHSPLPVPAPLLFSLPAVPAVHRHGCHPAVSASSPTASPGVRSPPPPLPSLFRCLTRWTAADAAAAAAASAASEEGKHNGRRGVEEKLEGGAAGAAAAGAASAASVGGGVGAPGLMAGTRIGTGAGTATGTDTGAAGTCRGTGMGVGMRNVAIIAHVDHGKTTLMDRLLRQCGAAVGVERVMDSIALERERGITIASKYTSVSYRDTTLNLVDTPGHADFGGEVERVMGMVEGALLLVDAVEGPLAQTKFVLAKALRQGLRPIVVLNKCDRPSVTAQMLEQAASSIFDLFASFDATEEQLNFPVLYASGRQGWATRTWPPPFALTQASGGDGGGAVRQKQGGSEGEVEGGPSITPILDTILEHVPEPTRDLQEPFQMLVSMVEKDAYLGRLLVGRVAAGQVRVGERVHALEPPPSSKTLSASSRRRDAETTATRTTQSPSASASAAAVVEEGRVVKLVKRHGVGRVEVDFAEAGDIVAVAGLSTAFVSHTLAHTSVSDALPAAAIDPPTLSMTFSVNDSPLGGRQGGQLTGPKIGERLRAEAETNVSLSVDPNASTDSSFLVMARGELQLGILIENMRREGFELSISPPTVLYRNDKGGKRLEPVEEVLIEVDDEYVGAVIDALSLRKGEMLDMIPDPVASHSRRTRLVFTCPSRGLLGFRSVLKTATHGTAIMHRSFLGYEPFRGALERVRRGVLVSMAPGTITTHALASLEARGTLFVQPGQETYDGHIIGENSREEDMEVNAVRSKELTNVRAAGKDENIRLSPPRQMNLEEAMAYVASDELVEVTPDAIRLRKRLLSSSKRKSQRRTRA